VLGSAGDASSCGEVYPSSPECATTGKAGYVTTPARRGGRSADQKCIVSSGVLRWSGVAAREDEPVVWGLVGIPSDCMVYSSCAGCICLRRQPSVRSALPRCCRCDRCNIHAG